MDQQAWLNTQESTEEAYRYFMRTDPDMRDFLGPIETEYDAPTNRDMRFRLAKVGMLRGGPESMMKEYRVYLDPIPHIRLEQGKPLQGWYKSKSDQFKQGSRARPCMTEAILTEPYGGTCSVGCAFCYINSGTKGYRGAGLITVPMQYGNHVRKQLATMRSSAAGYFSSFTDPFLPLEDYYHNTQNAALAFIEAGLPIFFLSRLAYPSWAYEFLKLNQYSYAQKSINTPHEDDWKHLSPGALSLEGHFEEIQRLRKQGTYVSIQVNPVVPGIVTHEDIELLFEKLAKAGANHVIVKFVEAGHSWAPAMVDRITKRFGGNRAAAFRDLFTENSAGAQKTIQEEYRMTGHRRYRAQATKLGMTYATCYEYAKRPEGWVSIGPEMTTADQCHGQRVPMFTRPSTDRMFREVKECPPSGCLSCAGKMVAAPEGGWYNAKKPKCGNEMFGEARALRMVDLKNPVKPK